MIVFPNAKVNLGLNIVSKRQDGYHNIETVFAPIPLKDTLEIIPTSRETSLHQSGSTQGINPEDNLCMKAYCLLKNDFPEMGNVEMWLHKTIPSGAGLGGGSSDASYTLALLNRMFELSLSNEQLRKYAIQLGSDCPFFIENKPLFAEGKGEEFTEINLDTTDYYWVIIKPSFSISTPEAYAGVSPQNPKNSLTEIIKLPVPEWKHRLKNDFENSLFIRYPELNTIKETLYASGALYASLSGSGSAMFGIYRGADFSAEKIAAYFSAYTVFYEADRLIALCT